MRILLAATPLAGHVNPVVSVAGWLVEDGHEVVVTTGSRFRRRIEATGARFVPPPDAIDIDMSDIDAAFPERSHLPPGPAQLAFDMNATFIDPIRAQYEGLVAILDGFDAEIVMSDMLFLGTLPLMCGARAAAPAVATLGIIPLQCRRDDGGPPLLGLPPAEDPAQIEAYAGLSATLAETLLAPADRRIDATLSQLGARPLPCSVLDAAVRLPARYLQLCAEPFDYPRRQLPPSVRFVGALPAAGPPLPPALRADIDQARAEGRRLVLVSQGTVANGRLGDLLGATLTALAGRSDLLVLATTGGRPVSDIPVANPDNARVAPMLAFDAIMPLLDVLVTNGGYGTVTQALSHGVPIVAAGAGEDKPEVCARIAWSGAGLDLHTAQPEPHRIAAAVDAVLGCRPHRRQAARLAAAFAACDARRQIPAILREIARVPA